MSSPQIGSGPLLYDAFISYSHATGWRLSARIQEALQQIAKPWNKAKALNIFRDETNLATSPDLWGDIETALQQSRHFILLCTPETVTSPWINKEIAYWIAHKPIKNIHLVWLTGAFAMDQVSDKILWEETNILPGIFREHFVTIPNYLDLRSYRDVSELSIKENPAFRNDLLKLAASIHGNTVEELDSRHVKEYRKAKLFRTTSLTLLSVLSVAILLIGIKLVNTNLNLAQSVADLERSDSVKNEVNIRLSEAIIQVKDREDSIKLNLEKIRSQNPANVRMKDSLLGVTQRLNQQIDFISELIIWNKTTEVNWEKSGTALHFKPKLASVYFDYDKMNLSAREVADIDLIFNFLNDNPSVKIEVCGFADGTATKVYSLEMGSVYARNAVRYLVSKGIAPGRIIAKSYGSQLPGDGYPGTNPDARIAALIRDVSRRIDVRLLSAEW